MWINRFIIEKYILKPENPSPLPSVELPEWIALLFFFYLENGTNTNKWFGRANIELCSGHVRRFRGFSGFCGTQNAPPRFLSGSVFQFQIKLINVCVCVFVWVGVFIVHTFRKTSLFVLICVVCVTKCCDVKTQRARNAISTPRWGNKGRDGGTDEAETKSSS